MARITVDIEYTVYTGENRAEVDATLATLKGDRTLVWESVSNSYNANLTVRLVGASPSSRFDYSIPLFLPVGSVVVAPFGGHAPLVLTPAAFATTYGSLPPVP